MSIVNKPNPASKTRQYLPDILSLAVFGVVFLLVNATRERVGSGWIWDFANGLGFAAVAGIVYVFMQHSARIATRYHRTFSYVIALLISAHALIFLFTDPLLLEYLKPGAPAYMWLGVIGFLLIILLILTAGNSGLKRAFVNFHAFRRWHSRLSWLALGAAVSHVVLSGLYIRGPVQFAFLALLMAVALVPKPVLKRVPARGFSSALFLIMAVFLALALAVSLNVGLP